jgi:hypothetical protein
MPWRFADWRRNDRRYLNRQITVVEAYGDPRGQDGAKRQEIPGAPPQGHTPQPSSGQHSRGRYCAGVEKQSPGVESSALHVGARILCAGKLRRTGRPKTKSLLDPVVMATQQLAGCGANRPLQSRHVPQASVFPHRLHRRRSREPTLECNANHSGRSRALHSRHLARHRRAGGDYRTVAWVGRHVVRHMAQEQELVSTIARSDGQELVPIDTAELPAFLAMPVGRWDLPGAVGRRCPHRAHCPSIAHGKVALCPMTQRRPVTTSERPTPRPTSKLHSSAWGWQLPMRRPRN